MASAHKNLFVIYTFPLIFLKALIKKVFIDLIFLIGFFLLDSDHPQFLHSYHPSLTTSSASFTGLRSFSSPSVNRREWIINLIPMGISIEKLLPLPGVTSRVSWVCFQCSNWSLLIKKLQPYTSNQFHEVAAK
jgi:hypothetical protein